jgi:hypothetical protein
MDLLGASVSDPGVRSAVTHHHQASRRNRGNLRAWIVERAGGVDEHEDPGADAGGVRVPLSGAVGGVVDAGPGWVLPAATGSWRSLTASHMRQKSLLFERFISDRRETPGGRRSR